MVRFFTALVRTSLFVILGLVLCLYFTQKGEEDYQKNCRELGVACEEGQTTKRAESVWQDLKTLFQRLKSSLNGLTP